MRPIVASMTVSDDVPGADELNAYLARRVRESWLDWRMVAVYGPAALSDGMGV